MPQSVPLEASETLAFKPASLEDHPDCPVFHLRAPTSRDRRFQRRLLVEEQIQQHSQDAIRAEIRNGLKANWDEASYRQHMPRIEAYWNAWDEYALQRKDEPDLAWSYDEHEANAIEELERRVADSWPPLRRLMADNDNFRSMLPVVQAAIVVLEWSGLDDVRSERDRGYLTLDCAENLLNALGKYAEGKCPPDADDKQKAVAARTALLELFVACTGRFNLDEDTAGNSGSPSPSQTPPQSSSTTADPGSSKASASSTKTPATA